MTAKRTSKQTRKTKALRARGLSAKQAKNIKGGIIAVLAPKVIVGADKSTGLLVPAVQKVRE